jgi:hypothetical protein
VSEPIALRRLHLDPAATIAGVDVGEQFLDLAIVIRKTRRLIMRRIRLDDLAEDETPGTCKDTSSVIATIASRLRSTAPELANAIAIVDSPAWPADCDLSSEGLEKHRPHAAKQSSRIAKRVSQSGVGREIDGHLRRLIFDLRATGKLPALRPLALFPTPAFDYFARQILHDRCKPHLRAIGRELFALPQDGRRRRLIGGTFTRFMIAGFAAHRALRTICAQVYEGYPDLQFRLWCDESDLPPKKGRRATAGRPRVTAAAALAVRLRIIEALAGEISGHRDVKRIDEADAAVLAFGATAAAARGVVGVIEVRAEGNFMIAIPSDVPLPDALAFAR